MTALTTLPATEYKYLSEVMYDLPDRAYFNKVLTGCGGTTVALTNDKSYVICVPFISLIQNKLESAEGKEAFGFYGGIRVEDLQSYIETQSSKMRPKKILVTYDSLAKLCGCINPSEYKLLVDEAHKLLDSASFRERAVRSVMKHYELFGSYVFMTATPVKDEYQLPELKELPRVEIDWGDIVPVTLTKMRSVKKTELYDNVVLTLLKHLDGELEGVPYVFMNSVVGICDIINGLQEAVPGITQSDVKIICADNELNQSKLDAKLDGVWKIEKASSKSKRINFCTSTAFEGCDIYCEEGVTYIVSDGNKLHTKYDILTTIPQIVGRIRNSKYKNEVKLIYSDTPYYRYLSAEEYSTEVTKELERSIKYVSRYQSMYEEDGFADKAVQTLHREAVTDPYIYVDGELLEINAWSWHNEMHNYEVVNTRYSVRLEGVDCVNKTPYVYNDGEVVLDSLTGISKLVRQGNSKKKQSSFKQVCEEYVELQEKPVKTKYMQRCIVLAETRYPWLKEAYEKLGADTFKRLRYVQEAIKRESASVRDVGVKEKVRLMLNLQVGFRYSSQELKKKFKVIQSRVAGVPGTASAVEEYYKVKSTSWRNDGKKVVGYIIQGVK